MVKDAFSLWLNQNIAPGEQIANWRFQYPSSCRTQVQRKRSPKALHCQENWRIAVRWTHAGRNCFWLKEILQAVPPSRRGIGSFRLSCRCAENTEYLGEVDSDRSAGFAGGSRFISVAIGVEPGSDDLSISVSIKSVFWRMPIRTVPILPLCCALFVRHFRKLVQEGMSVAMPPLYRIDAGKQVFYALDDSERQGVLDRIAAEKLKGKSERAAIQGTG